MDRDQVDPFARLLVSSYLSTAAYSREFTDTWDSPPTTAAKAHHFRAIVQAQVNQNERYLLHGDYIEFGRVQIKDTETDANLLIRSQSAVSIENAHPELTLFDIVPARRVDMLIYGFDQHGMRLSGCGTRRAASRKRLLPAGELTYIGFWPYDSFPPDDQPFDQGDIDPFGDLGSDLDIDYETRSE